MRWTQKVPRHNLGYFAWAFSLFLLFLPSALLGFLALRTHSSPSIAIGAGVVLLLSLVFLRAHPVWRPPVSASVVTLYLIALVWAWVQTRASTYFVPHVVQGVLLLVGVLLLASHDLVRTGAEPLRRANTWVRRIQARRQWPAQRIDCRVLPEAIGLRNAIQNEPGPALALLSDPRSEVQTTALGALEHRPHWRAGEAEYVLKFARESDDAAVRSAAVYALAGVSDPELVAGLAGFLRDPAPEVRLAASEALLWEADARWPFARDGVREAMADYKAIGDGPLFLGIGRIPAAAVADLITWSSEHPPLAHRAILTLIEHYNADLMSGERPELASELAVMMLEPETPPALRVELAALLRDHQMLSPDLLDRLTNLDQPGPMRLFAAELMLRINPHDPDGIDVLRGLARQPNREMAVQVAAVLQNVLGLNVGLPEGELPASNSKQAADLARRVLAWANGANPDILMNPTPGPRPGLGSTASRHTMSGFGTRSSLTGIPHTPMPIDPDLSPMDESAMIPREDVPTQEEVDQESEQAGENHSGQEDQLVAGPDPSIEESHLFPMERREREVAPAQQAASEESSLFPMDDSAMLPLGESALIPKTRPIPPPLPKRPPRPGSSAVI